MNKIVYNACYGGFSLSHEAVMLYAELAGLELSWITKWSLNHYFHGDCTGMTLDQAYEHLRDFSPLKLDRHDPVLVQTVEELGKAANGSCAELRVFETQSNQYMIEEYDGNEAVAVSYDDSWIYIK